MAKDWAKDFYNSKAWQACRDGYIASVHGVCERCLERGCINVGYIVHHKIKLTPDNIKDSNISLNWDNLEYVCLDCHNTEHGEHKDIAAEGLCFDASGQLIMIQEVDYDRSNNSEAISQV